MIKAKLMANNHTVFKLLADEIMNLYSVVLIMMQPWIFSQTCVICYDVIFDKRVLVVSSDLCVVAQPESSEAQYHLHYSHTQNLTWTCNCEGYIYIYACNKFAMTLYKFGYRPYFFTPIDFKHYLNERKRNYKIRFCT